ncbi:MAG TPA: fumarylacetoacetate hydrolase family protein [Magnetospirillaceae bacterium]|jgi:fumarylpyruvate hydrolase
MADYVIAPPALTTLEVVGGGLFPIRRVFCVGRNYAAHAREMGGDPNREPPFFFTKPADAVTSAAAIPYPTITKDMHHEGELVVAIGTGGKEIAAKDSLSHIFGYAVGCDLTRRDLQAALRKEGRPWDMAKGFDFAGPAGAIHPASKIGHPDKGAITLSVDGVEKQKGDLADMVWSIPEIVETLSRYVALAAGDLIFTGTPEGVGPVVRGNTLEIKVAGVGAHKFQVV